MPLIPEVVAAVVTVIAMRTRTKRQEKIKVARAAMKVPPATVTPYPNMA